MLLQSVLSCDGEALRPTERESLWFAESNPYDVKVFDVMMPGKDGFTASAL